jgi:pSer/pThr/pTyr-binding forkhead associated (FHA) protein
VSSISLSSTPPSAPRLEFYQAGSSELQRVTVERSPFRIGRCETCDLRIDSVQVSREHAQLYQRGNIWTVRDLGSTNGTQINGKPVRESFLSDGDILTIAETEVTFVASSVTPFQRMATQPIQSREALKRPALLPSEIAQARALNEATLWQAIPLGLATIVSLDSGDGEACLAQLADAVGAGDPEWQSSSLAVGGRHYRALARRLAVEKVESQIAVNRFLLTADVADFDSPEQLCGEFEQLRDQLPLDSELGVTISLRRILDLATLDDACREVRNAELLLALVGFQGSSGQVAELESHAPDYLVLSDSMLKGVTAGGQPLRRLELVLTTCQQLGIKAVLPECSCQRTMAQCRQLGYEFAIQTGASPAAVDHHAAVAMAG